MLLWNEPNHPIEPMKTNTTLSTFKLILNWKAYNKLTFTHSHKSSESIKKYCDGAQSFPLAHTRRLLALGGRPLFRWAAARELSGLSYDSRSFKSNPPTELTRRMRTSPDCTAYIYFFNILVILFTHVI